MREYLKITVVTPNYNGAEFLERTIVSVVSQAYPNLEYIIVDGQSSDASMRIAEKYAGGSVHIICERDNGHEDAVNKGFARGSGDVMGWINSDDILMPGSLSLVNEVFQQFSDVDWITGRATTILESDMVSSVWDNRPWSWLRFLGGDYRYIQQESTFWRRKLWERAGGGLSNHYKLANDLDLWTRFFLHAPLFSVDSLIGSFRYREGQRSVRYRQDYERECELILTKWLDVIPASCVAKYLDVLLKGRPTLPSHSFSTPPAELAALDPPVIRYHSGEKKFSRKNFFPEKLSDPFLGNPQQEDLAFNGSERVTWTTGPNLADSNLVALDAEFLPRRDKQQDGEGLVNDVPPLVLLMGPLALSELPSGEFQVQLRYTTKLITHAIRLPVAETSVRLKVLLTRDHYAIIVNGSLCATGDLDGEQLSQGRHTKIGGVLLSRYWTGVMSRIAVTVRPRAVERGSKAITTSIAHHAGVRKLPREEKKTQSTTATPESPNSRLSRFRGIHTNQRCFVMGNGPSLNKMDLELLKGEIVFCCNSAFLLFDRVSWRPRYFTCVDSRVLLDRVRDIVNMLDTHPDIVAFFPSVIGLHDGSNKEFDCRDVIPTHANRYYFKETYNFVSDSPRSMFSLDVDQYVVQPYTVSITMLQLAAYMGFKEIFLIGCDTDYKVADTVKQEGRTVNGVGLLLTSTKDDDANHFDPRYFGKGREWHNPQVGKMIEHHEWALKALEQTPTRVFNATVGGRLEVYPRVSFESLFKSAVRLTR
jgi:hypothetical protein